MDEHKKLKLLKENGTIRKSEMRLQQLRMNQGTMISQITENIDEPRPASYQRYRNLMRHTVKSRGSDRRRGPAETVSYHGSKEIRSNSQLFSDHALRIKMDSHIGLGSGHRC